MENQIQNSSTFQEIQDRRELSHRQWLPWFQFVHPKEGGINHTTYVVWTKTNSKWRR